MRIDASTLSTAYSGFRASQTRSAASGSSSGGQTTATDSSSISSQGFAALLEEQRQQPPALTEDQASAFGQQLQQDDADLFSQVDTDSDGTLSVDEMESNKETLQSYMQSKDSSQGHGGPGGPGGPGGAGGPPPPPPSDSSSSSSEDDEDDTTSTLLEALDKTLKDSDSDLFSALDGDSDGSVSADELLALLQDDSDSADQLRTNLLRDLLSPLLSSSVSA